MRKSVFTSQYKNLVASLVEMRKTAGLTQRELADRLGRERSFIARVETGQRRVDLVELVWWCEACDADATAKVSELVDQIRDRKHRGR
jgi:transcriptional regulator with XRE-family HTH domain